MIKNGQVGTENSEYINAKADEANGAEVVRLRKFKALAQKFIGQLDAACEHCHGDGCLMLEYMDGDTELDDSQCDCGLIELMKELD